MGWPTIALKVQRSGHLRMPVTMHFRSIWRKKNEKDHRARWHLACERFDGTDGRQFAK